MGLFIIFMMTLLLQSTKENAESKTQTTSEPDNSERFGEFCLRIFDDSHWTSTESAPHLPTKSEEATKHAAQQPKQPTQPTRQAPKLPNQSTQPNRESTQLLEKPTTEPTLSDSQSTRPPTQSTPGYWESTQLPEDDQYPLEIVTHEVNEITMPPVAFHSNYDQGCRCQGKETKPPSETSRVIEVTMRLPSQTCSSTEVIETLNDGSEVCVTASDFLSSYDKFVRRFFQPVAAHQSNSKELLDTAPTPVDPTELPITTPPHELNPQPTIIDYIDYEYNGFADGQHCGFCSIKTNLDIVDPKAVQSLNVMMQPSPCPAHVYVSLKDAEDLCLDEFFPADVSMVEKLEIPPPHEVIDGCRCREREQKLPDETSPVISTRIWPPSETCNSTEFIETLTDGREVCVTASTILVYLLAAPIQRSAFSVLAPEVNTLPVLTLPGNGYPVGEKEEAGFPPKGAASVRVSIVETFEELPHAMCKRCRIVENLSNVDPNNVQSLGIHVQSFGCPASIHVWLKNGEDFCVSTPDMELRTLVKKLESQGH